MRRRSRARQGWWTSSSTRTVTRCVVFFHKLLGVPLISSEFPKYLDALLFALAVHSDVDVAKYDPSLEQSQATFGHLPFKKRNMCLGEAICKAPAPKIMMPAGGAVPKWGYCHRGIISRFSPSCNFEPAPFNPSGLTTNQPIHVWSIPLKR